MNKHHYPTEKGTIVYWTSTIDITRNTLVFLPGLTADHRLFDKQIEALKDKYNVFVWDAPGHASSRPFELNFTLFDKARWLHEILQNEQITSYYLIGQSMGGYVAQAYLELYPNEPKGFVSIDSAPLQKAYMTGLEIWALRHVEPIYHLYPWKSLMKAGSQGVAESAYGKQLMHDMMDVYTSDKKYYCHLCGHGYRMLADAIDADLPYLLSCPTALICGEKDKAGSAKNYNKRWHEKTGLPLHWIKDAGHNANTDKPDEINRIIEDLVTKTN